MAVANGYKEINDLNYTISNVVKILFTYVFIRATNRTKSLTKISIEYAISSLDT